MKFLTAVLHGTKAFGTGRSPFVPKLVIKIPAVER
jgi:hypothetical protein